jgi:hypothetical protein
MALLHDDNATGGIAKVTVDRISSVVQSTLWHRKAAKASLQIEIQVLQDTLGNLLEAERLYQSKMDILPAMKGLPGTPSPLSTLPNFVKSQRAASTLSLVTESPIGDLAVSAGQVVRDPVLHDAQAEMMNQLRCVDRDLNLHSHRIKTVFLQIMSKLRQVDKLDAEVKAATPG